MLSYGVAIVLAMVVAKADPIDDARKAFNNCMLTMHNEKVREKVSVDDFGKAADAGCATEKQSYHAIVVKSEKSFGSSAKEASDYADEEVQAVIATVKSAFADNLEKGGILSLEK